MKALYPKIDPYNEFDLNVSDLHTIHVEESGTPEGKPVIFLHGGPGGGIESIYRQYFDPEKYRIIIFDQRGCGKSTPHAELRENTTWDLVADIEKIREHLEINKWVVFGGSWGSTLSLSYAITHPDRCKALVLRGIFMIRKKEIDWFYQKGASNIYPDAWEHYLKPIPENERHDMVAAYYKRLTSEDEKVRIEAAKAWSIWEASTSKLFQSEESLHPFEDAKVSEAFARIECHYFTNRGFFDAEEWLLENVDKIRHIPAVIVQGRYDVVCPMVSAWELHRAFPEADFEIIQDAGHSMTEKGIASKLVEYTDKFVEL
ncbi:MAG: prolyl aminopeptidase [Candidatus Marinimicrobia bacterium]|nr:prolyl aminopeptidase [Candidatus Neomarinimicrobiota bacterium]